MTEEDVAAATAAHVHGLAARRTGLGSALVASDLVAALAPTLAALRAGKPVPVPRRPTLADGLATLTMGANAFAIARQNVDRVVSVTEDWISLAILRMLELEKSVVEGAAATPLAATPSTRSNVPVTRSRFW